MTPPTTDLVSVGMLASSGIPEYATMEMSIFWTDVGEAGEKLTHPPGRGHVGVTKSLAKAVPVAAHQRIPASAILARKQG
jgi:hypothetical protein